MSVTAAKGFHASGVAAGLKSSGKLDVCLIVNAGPKQTAIGVVTGNRIKAAPVVWTQQVLKDGELHAVAANSGGANACTGPEGFADTHRTAEHVAKLLSCGAGDIAVLSTGLIGERLPMDKLLPGFDAAFAGLSEDGGDQAAQAIMTTDTVPKTAVFEAEKFTVGGMAKGAAMLAPGLATMLCTITTDAELESHVAGLALKAAVRRTFERVDSDGCMSTNDAVLVLASGASGYAPTGHEFSRALQHVCASLCRQLVADAEGASKDIKIEVTSASTEAEATTVGRAVSRSNLFKCAIHGEDPNWGRILAAVGTTDAEFKPDEISVAINGVWVCKDGAAGEDRTLVDMSGREVTVSVDLNAGHSSSTIWTNDLTAEYVHENSAYST